MTEEYRTRSHPAAARAALYAVSFGLHGHGPVHRRHRRSYVGLHGIVGMAFGIAAGIVPMMGVCGAVAGEAAKSSKATTTATTSNARTRSWGCRE